MLVFCLFCVCVALFCKPLLVFAACSCLFLLACACLPAWLPAWLLGCVCSAYAYTYYFWICAAVCKLLVGIFAGLRRLVLSVGGHLSCVGGSSDGREWWQSVSGGVRFSPPSGKLPRRAFFPWMAWAGHGAMAGRFANWTLAAVPFRLEGDPQNGSWKRDRI